MAWSSIARIASAIASLSPTGTNFAALPACAIRSGRSAFGVAKARSK